MLNFTGNQVIFIIECHSRGNMAKLVDALDLGSSGFGRGGSSPFARTNDGTVVFVGLSWIIY